MANKTEPLKSTEAKIQELENRIRDREEQLRKRTGRFKKELQQELSPEELVRRYPFRTTGLSLLIGFFTGKLIRKALSRQPQQRTETDRSQRKEPSELKSALGSIGLELLRSGKDIAISYLKHSLDKKIKPG